MSNSQNSGNRPAFNKSNPSANGQKFIPIPSNARHYVHHDAMSADKLFLYALIIDYFNVDTGVAWPSVERLAVDYGKSSKTTGLHIRDLITAGLIVRPKTGKYVPLEPLSPDDFYAANPSALKRMLGLRETAKKRSEEGLERLEQFRRERDTRVNDDHTHT
ncbi:helix-turn-helix domain-containing protein [Indiicoccus explosivorum]|uniref:helix-turn-helix domain-containing protein n=1 Tax=Indiicoccus explosivorum TaxID=1917864 RepID=UPI000B44C7B3|nr:helix-turn-helix domain-containing protein [Indiicoccus explosivorum]